MFLYAAALRLGLGAVLESSPFPSLLSVGQCQDVADGMQKETDFRSFIGPQSHHFTDQVHLCDVCERDVLVQKFHVFPECDFIFLERLF